jgi:PilZ domain
MSQDGKLRRHDRADVSSPAKIVWQDRNGRDCFMNGQALDVSASGIRVEVADPIEMQTYVTVQCSALSLHGRASVRSCTRKGMKYILGLEFSAGLRWKPPQGSQTQG